jgi:hypothetical protein
MRIKTGLLLTEGSSLNYNIYECTIKINAGTTATLNVAKAGGGTLNPDTYEIRLNEYADGIDAVAWKMDATGTYRLNELAEDALGNVIVVTLSGAGNRTYTLSAAPSAYPIIVSFVILASGRIMNNADWDYVMASTPYYGGGALSDGTTIAGTGVAGDELRRYAELVQIGSGSLGAAETTGNKVYFDLPYDFTVTSWRLTGEKTGGGNIDIKIDLQRGGASVIGAGVGTYPLIAGGIAATGIATDWTDNTWSANDKIDVLVESTTDTERWRLTLFGYRT